ncbi:MAG: ATP-dependent helicase, partial [Nitrosotalea sp.]
GSPLLVTAGPGSGKTKVIVERIKHLVEHGLKPSEILCLTFSEKAALVMKDRLDEMKIDTTEIQISTFHSFCHDILLENVLDSGIGIGSGVINRSSLLVWGLKNIDSFGFGHIEITNNAVEVIEAIMDGISTFKDELISPEELREYLDKKLAEEKKLVSDVEQLDYLHKLEDLHRVYVQYRDYLRSNRFIDFDDMVVLSINLFRKKPITLASYQKRFKYVLVDEFQDNNFAQFELVKLLTPNGNLTVVGDDDQSIYRFQGAYDAIFDHFRQTYPNHTEILLSKNYRNPSSVVELSSQLLEIVPDRNHKNLVAVKKGNQKVIVTRCNHDMAEVEFVIDQIREIVEPKNGVKSLYSFKDIAILSRKRADGKKFAQVLNSHGIPATFVGEAQIFSSSVGRDLLAYLQIASDPAHAGISINRVLKIWGINEQDIAKINYEAQSRTRNNDSDLDLVFEVMTDLKVNELTQIVELKDISNMLHALSNLK